MPIIFTTTSSSPNGDKSNYMDYIPISPRKTSSTQLYILLTVIVALQSIILFFNYDRSSVLCNTQTNTVQVQFKEFESENSHNTTSLRPKNLNPLIDDAADATVATDAPDDSDNGVVTGDVTGDATADTINAGSDKKPFNRTNPFKDSWCPNAQCFNSPVCTPCNRRFLFILATGRSGSTTLLKMLNQLPNVRLSGENYNELYLSSHLLTNLENTVFENENYIKKGRLNKPRIDGPFEHNALPIGFMSCPIQNIATALNPPIFSEDTFEMEDDSKTILGMKLIRIQRGDWSPDQAAKFFQDNFPCARFIVNIRSNVEEQVQSYQTNFHWNLTATELIGKNMFLRQLDKNLGSSSKLTDMTYWKKENDTKTINEVVDWLGFENCKFDGVPHENNHGYEPDRESEFSLGKNCRYPHV